MGYSNEYLEKQMDLVVERNGLRMFLSQAMEALRCYGLKFTEELVINEISLYQLDSDLSVESNVGANVSFDNEKSRCAELLSFAITKIERLESQHPKRTYRLPGVVNVDGNTYENVKNIIKTKKLIKFAMIKANILDGRERGVFFKKYINSNIMLKELYRKPTLLGNEVGSISFTWGNHVPQTHILTKKEVVDILNVELEFAEQHSKFSSSKIADEIQLVKDLSSASVLKTIRGIPPHPRGNIKYLRPKIWEDGRLTDRVQRHSYLPFFINGDECKASSYSISGLKDSEGERRKERPNNNAEFELLIGRLNLHVSRRF
jgi:hypothetical protein